MLAVGDSSGAPSSTGVERRSDESFPATKIAAILIAFTVALRLAHLVLVAPTPLVGFHKEFVDSDMWFFDQWAQRIAAGDWLGHERFHPLAAWQLGAAPAAKWLEWYGSAPTFYKAPFYAYLLAVLSFLGAPALGMFVLQAAAAGLSAWLLLGITRDLFGTTASVWAIALFAFYAPDIHFSAVLLRGPWIVLSTLFVTDRLLALARRPSASRAVLAGLSAALAMLVNEAMTPLVILAPLALFLSGAIRPGALKHLTAFAAGALAGLAPVVMRNLVVGAPPFQIAVTGSVVLAVFNSATSDPLLFSARPENFAPVMNLAGSSVFETLLACARSFATPADWLGFYALKIAGLIAPFENPDNVNFYYAALVNPWLGLLPAWGVLLPLTMVGGLLCRPHHRGLFWCVVPAPLTLLAAMLLTLPLSRYRAVWAIHLMPFAGVALSRGFSWMRERSLAKVTGLAVAIAAVMAVQFWVQRQVFWGPGRAQGLVYRPAEFVLAARMEASAGHFAAAAREMDHLAALHPEAGVKLQAMTLAAQYRDQERAAKGAIRER